MLKETANTNGQGHSYHYADTTIALLQNKVATLEGRITRLETQVAHFKGLSAALFCILVGLLLALV